MDWLRGKFTRKPHRRKFRSQTSDNMDRWKAEMGRVGEEKRRRKRKSQKKEDEDARKGRKVAKHFVFPMICGSGGSKSRLAKAAGAEPSGEMRDGKIARRCGAKHISKSKCTKHIRFGPLLEVALTLFKVESQNHSSQEKNKSSLKWGFQLATIEI